MSHWTLKKEVQNPIVLSVLLRSIAANLDLQIKLDLDFVRQRVKSFLWNKGRWAGSALLSLLTYISIWDSGVNLHTWAPDGGSCLTHSISRQIQFHHSDTRCSKDVQRLMLANCFCHFPNALSKNDTLGRQEVALWDIAESLVGAGGSGAHQSTLNAHRHFGNTEIKGRDKTLHYACIWQLRLSHC